MSNSTKKPENVLKNLSRRKLLRDSALAATGAILLPSFITGCNKDVWDKVKGHIPGGLGDSIPLTNFELYSAAQNLRRMNDWIMMYILFVLNMNFMYTHF